MRRSGLCRPYVYTTPPPILGRTSCLEVVSPSYTMKTRHISRSRGILEVLPEVLHGYYGAPIRGALAGNHKSAWIFVRSSLPRRGILKDEMTSRTELVSELSYQVEDSQRNILSRVTNKFVRKKPDTTNRYNTLTVKDWGQEFVSGSSELKLLRLPFFLFRKDFY
ncbi:DNA helicase Mer3 [Dorcoceras hygrometricum]|uniref:DNA helicase Mer3 n=1 Tax=Dorcoceras hygrometricum TaxID=472368 RepID=A0A2Z7CSC4_9LAMI|nr:DNA helicase Mer3 [Dorcoceras hygrometricum]